MNSHLFDSCLVSVNNNVALPKVDIKPSFWMTSKTVTIYAYIHCMLYTRIHGAGHRGICTCQISRLHPVLVWVPGQYNRKWWFTL